MHFSLISWMICYPDSVERKLRLANQSMLEKSKQLQRIEQKVHSSLACLATARFSMLGSGVPFESPHSPSSQNQNHSIALNIPPILTYHHIKDTVAVGENPMYTVTPQKFEAEMEFLHDQQFQTMSMAQYIEFRTEKKVLPPKTLVLTFDDGFAEMYSEVFPVLKKFGFTGTFYIITGVVGETGYLSWQELEEMKNVGMEIGGHTVHHMMLVMNQKIALAEIEGCLKSLADHLGLVNLTFAYPYNDHNQQVKKMVMEARYETIDHQLATFSSAVILDMHTGDDPEDAFTIVRITVSRGESMAFFAEAVRLGYFGINHIKGFSN